MAIPPLFVCYRHLTNSLRRNTIMDKSNIRVNLDGWYAEELRRLSTTQGITVTQVLKNLLSQQANTPKEDTNGNNR